MKPKEKKPQEVYRIIDRATGESVGSYSRGYSVEYNFASVSMAREADCHGTFQDKQKYAIAKYRVTYELIEADVDGEAADNIPAGLVEIRIPAGCTVCPPDIKPVGKHIVFVVPIYRSKSGRYFVTEQVARTWSTHRVYTDGSIQFGEGIHAKAGIFEIENSHAMAGTIYVPD